MVKIYISNVNLCSDEMILKAMVEAIPDNLLNKSNFDLSKRSHVLSRFLLFKAITYIYSLDEAKKLRLIKNSNGKLYFANEDIYFNISHSNEIVACGISDKEIGIDIEKMRKYNPLVVKRFFHEDEYKFLQSIEKDKQDFYFTKLWTMKEAIVKNRGEALALNLKKYNFSIKDNELVPNFEAKNNFNCITSEKQYILTYCGYYSRKDIEILNYESSV